MRRWDGLADRLLGFALLGMVPVSGNLFWMVRGQPDPIVRWFPLLMLGVLLVYGAEQIYPGWHRLEDYRRDGNGPAIIDGDQSE